MTRLLTYFQRARREDGFTLIESLVTLLIISIMLTVSVSLIGLLFDSQSKTLLQFEQQQTLQETSGFLNARLGSTKDIGIVEGGEINPLSVASDQLVFTSGGTCYRVFYVQSLKQVRYKTAADCNDIKPTRGPNQTSGPADAVLDSSAGSIILADNVSPTPTISAPADAPNPLNLFTYMDADGAAIAGGPDTRAGVGTSSDWYSDSANLDNVLAVDVTMYMKGSGPANRSANRYFNTTVNLGQISSGGSGGGEPAIASVSVKGQDAESPSSFMPLTAGGGYAYVSRTFRTPEQVSSIDPAVQETNRSLYSKTSIFPVAHSKITYSGYVTFKSTSSSPVEVYIRPVLMHNVGGGSSTQYEPVDNDGWGTGDGGTNQDGNIRFSNTGDYSTAKKLEFSGSYNIPFRTAVNPEGVYTGNYPADTKYYIDLRVQSTTPGSEVSYSTASTQQLLKYKIEPLSS